MKVVLCLLTRNEIDCLNVLLPKLPKPGPDSGFDEICAIDGFSTDGTVEKFKEHGIAVISQAIRGRGGAMLTAFSQVPADAWLFFSPDGNESIDDLKKFKPLLEQGKELVIASRMMKDGRNEEDDKIFRWRKWANKVFNLFANLFFRKEGPYVTDSINGFRAISAAAVKKIQPDAADYTIEYQMTMRAMAARLNIFEFPTIESHRIAGHTGAPSIPTGIRFVRRFFIELARK